MSVLERCCLRSLLVCLVLLAVFATPALAVEAPVTWPAVPGTTSVALRGELDPGRGGKETVKYYFAYSTSGSACTEGKTAPAEASEYQEAGGHRKAVSLTANGLEPNREYVACLAAVNPTEPNEVSVGNQVSFKTLAVAPTIKSGSAKAVEVTPFSVKVEGEVNPENDPVACVVEYGPTMSYGDHVSCGSPIGSAEQTVSAGVSGLSPKTSYDYRVVLEDETTHAKEYGENATFKTLTEAEANPAVESEKVEAPTVTPVGATVEAKVDPDYLGTSCKVEYSTDETKVSEGKAGGVQECSVPVGGKGSSVTTGLSGLEPAQTYYYRLVVTDTGAPHLVGDGTIESFTTGAAKKPVVDKETTSNVTPTGATLEATVDPEYQPTTGCEFEYGKTTGSITENKASCSPATLEGSGEQGVSATVTGLKPNTAYQFRVVVTNATGTAPVMTEGFATLTGEDPVVEGLNATSITPNEEALEATVNPDYQATTCEFEYGTNTVNEYKAPCSSELNGGPGQSVSVDVSGLTGETLYKYGIIVKNATGGETKTGGMFTTSPPVPFVESEGYGQLTQTSVVLEAQINPEGQSTAYGFEYAKSELELLKDENTTFVTGEGELSGTSSEHAAVTVHDLTPNTLYFFRAVATNKSGTEKGPGNPPFQIQSFMTGSIPLDSTGTATDETSSSVTLPGTVTPEGIATTYYFQYGGTTQYGAQTPAQSAGAGDGTLGVQAQLSGLQPGVIYHYRIVATNTNSSGTVQTTYGEDETFKTTATPPTVESITGTATGQSTATITAQIDGQGLPTRWEVQLGESVGALSEQAFGNQESAGTLTLGLVSLSPGTTYYYKVIVVNQNGTIGSTVGSFTTAPAPAAAVTSAPAAIVFSPSANQLANVKTSATTTKSTKKKASKKHRKAKKHG
jgi:phosphodiesterase/alkaline phosphatase D-like protein